MHQNPPSGKVGKRFVGILSVELDGFCARKWNAERVVFFQSVILQHAQGVNNYTQILKRVLFRLDCWNCGAFDELMKDMYNSVVRYLVKSCRNKTEKESHRMFLNLFLKGKLRVSV